MSSASARAASYVLTLEEIGNLAAEGGKPAETLMNVVALIARRFQTDVCSVYLLEPDRANLVLAATVGLRPQCIGTLRMALQRRAGRPGGRAGAPGGRRAGEQLIRASSISAKRAKKPTSRFCGVPLIDRGVLQGVLVVQTIEARAFSDDEMRMLVEAAAQVAPVVSEARTLDRFIAPVQERLWALARNLWWSWDHDSTSLFRDLDPVRWRQLNHNPIALLSEIPAREARAPRRRTGAAQPHQLRLSPPAGISAMPTAPGARRMPAFCGRGRWRISRPSSACTNRFRFIRAAWAFWRATTSRARPIWTFRWSASACFTAKAISGSGWIAKAGSRKNTCRPTSVSCPWSRPSARTASRLTVQIETRSGIYSRQGVAGEGGPLRSAAARFERRRQRAGGPRAHLAALRRRRPHAHSPGTAAGRGRLPRLEGHGHHAGRSAPERRPQRIRGAGSDSPAGWRKKGSSFEQAVPRVAREVVFTTHTPVPAGHDRFDAGLIEEHLGPLRERLGLSHDRLMALGREIPATRAKSSA